MTAAHKNRIAALIAQHRATPDISYDTHMRRKIVALGHSLKDKVRIYLDVKYWLILRDIESGVSSNEAAAELLKVLRAKVASGRLFCPISESVYLELLKQSDPRTRFATARLIDELSGGIALSPFDIRTATELQYALHVIRDGNADALDPLDALIWTRVGHVMGMDPQMEFPPMTEDADVIRKAMFDDMWTLTAVELVELSERWRMPAPESFESLTRYINEGNAQHVADLRSFSQAYNAELQGGIDACIRLTPDVMQAIAVVLDGRLPPRSSIRPGEPPRWRKQLARELKRPEMQKILTTPHIQGCIHASVRWDKRRQVEPNDIYDFNHASDALPYCDAFFTEGPLRATLTAKHIALDKLYECFVCSEVTEAVEYLKSLD